MLYSSCKGIVRQIYIFFSYRQKNRATGRKKCRFIRNSRLGQLSPQHVRPVPDYFLPGFYQRRAGCVRVVVPGPVDRGFRVRLSILQSFRSNRMAYFGILKKGYIFVVLIRNEDFPAVKRQESTAETAKCRPIQTPEYKRIDYAKGVICILIST